MAWKCSSKSLYLYLYILLIVTAGETCIAKALKCPKEAGEAEPDRQASHEVEFLQVALLHDGYVISTGVDLVNNHYIVLSDSLQTRGSNYAKNKTVVLSNSAPTP